MDAIISDIALMVEDPDTPVLVAGLDRRRVPKLTVTVDAGVHEASLAFALDAGAPLAEALLDHPFCAVSVLQPGGRGYQLKGKARLVEARERRFYPVGEPDDRVFVLAAQEIFAVEPLINANLKRPLWECEKPWAEDRFHHHFSFELASDEGIALDDRLLAEIRELDDRIQEEGLAAYVVTVNEYGVPNISPRTLVSIDPDSWLWGDCAEHKTARNLKLACMATVALVDWSSRTGFEASGWVKVSEDPEEMEKIRAFWEVVDFQMPVMHANRFYYEELDRITPAGLVNLIRAEPGKSALCPHCV